MNMNKEHKQDKLKRHFENSDELCNYIAEWNNKYCFMMFSGGIDSIAMFIHLKKYFDKIVPIYMYTVPDVEFINRYLNYFEHFFGKKILRIPHPKTVRLLEKSAYNYRRNPQNSFSETYDMDSMIVYVAKSIGFPPDTMMAIGNKMVDNPKRFMSIKKYGSVNYKRAIFYPIFDWQDSQVKETIKQSGCKIPIDYKIFGRSFDGLVYRFSEPLKKHFPNDFKQVQKYFPLIDVEIMRGNL